MTSAVSKSLTATLCNQVELLGAQGEGSRITLVKGGGPQFGDLEALGRPRESLGSPCSWVLLMWGPLPDLGFWAVSCSWGLLSTPDCRALKNYQCRGLVALM